MRETDAKRERSRTAHDTLRVVLAEIIACCDTVSKRLNHPLPPEKFQKLFHLSGPANFPEFLRIASELRDELFTIMDALPEEKKQLTLFYRRVLDDDLAQLKKYIASKAYPEAMTRHLLEESGPQAHEALVEEPHVNSFRH